MNNHSGISGKYEIVKILIDRGARVNHANKYGFSALDYAKRAGKNDLNIFHYTDFSNIEIEINSNFYFYVYFRPYEYRSSIRE